MAQDAAGPSTPTIKAMLKTLKAQLAELDRDINDTVKSSPACRAADELLTSVPGVGEVTSRTLIADLPELGRGEHDRPDEIRMIGGDNKGEHVA